jgi:hypothetical protein
MDEGITSKIEFFLSLFFTHIYNDPLVNDEIVIWHRPTRKSRLRDGE